MRGCTCAPGWWVWWDKRSQGLQEGDNKMFTQLKTDSAISHWRRTGYLAQVENTDIYLGFRIFKI